MKSPVISVLLPVYNGVDYLRTTVASVQRQSFPDWEILLCDDVSKDSSLALCRELAAADPRLRVFSNQKNLRIPGNINKLSLEARGDYLCILSQDDVLEPEYFATLIESARRTGADLTMCDFIEIDGKGVRRHTTHHAPWTGFIFRGTETLFEPAELVSEIYRRNSLPFSITSLIRAERFRAVRGYNTDYPYICDSNFHLDLLLDGTRVCFIARQLFHYRRHDQMTTLREGRSRMAEEHHYVLARHLPRVLPLLSSGRWTTAFRIFRRAWKRLLISTLLRSYPTRVYWRDMLKSFAASVIARRYAPAGGTLEASHSR